MRQRKASAWQKASFFVVVVIILAIVGYTGYGIAVERDDYMRFGIDIKGGVSATFQPADEDVVPTDEQLEAAKAIIELRLDNNNILDRTVTIQKENHAINVEFPWQKGEEDYDPVAAIQELGEIAQLSFSIVSEAESTDEGAIDLTIDGVTAVYYTIDETFMDGSMVSEATAGYLDGEYGVSLEFTSEGTTVFGETTTNHVGDLIGIMMDDTLISVATINEAITGGSGYISGSFTAEEARSLAAKINSGALPFAMESTNYSSVSATMGAHSLNVMMLAGLIALLIIIIFMCSYYRAPGLVASIILLLQTAGQLLIFHTLNLTLTLPGIAGIILSIGMGVDSNIIISERIKEEVNAGKTLKGAISAGYSRALSAVVDCNVTTLATAILMRIFGTGSILSFSYTLIIGIVMNFISIVLSKIMIQSLSCYKVFDNLKLYGYKAKKEVE